MPESNEASPPAPATTANPTKQHRRPVACKSCHSLKVKCTPSDEANPAGPCIRCLNSKRVCEIDLNQPRKKRRKATTPSTALAVNPAIPGQHQQSAHPQQQQSAQHHQHQQHQLPQLPQNLKTDRPPLAYPISMQSSYSPAQMLGSTSLGQYPRPHLGRVSSAMGHLQHPQQHADHASAVLAAGTPLGHSYSAQLPQVYENKDERIQKLEEQIRILTSELSASRRNNLDGGSASGPCAPVTKDCKFISTPQYISKHDLEQEIGYLVSSSNAALAELTVQTKEASDKRAQLLKGLAPIDLVSINVLTLEEAEERLKMYQEEIYSRHRLIDIGENVTVESLRHAKPHLFNAIMAVSNSIYSKPIELEKTLSIDNAAMKLIATEILVAGTKSEELIQSLLLLCFWYNTPELFRQRRYHLLNVLSVTMLHDLGIVGKPSFILTKKGSVELSNSTTTTIINSPVPLISQEELKQIEYKKLIMLLFFSTVSICLMLRRTIYVKWTPYVDECCTILEKVDDPACNELALFLRLNHQLERIHHIIHFPDSTQQLAQGQGIMGAQSSFFGGRNSGLTNGPGPVHNLRTTIPSKHITLEFQKNLDEIKDRITPDNHPFLAYYYSVEAYLHEPMLGHVLTAISEDGTHARLLSDAITTIGTCTGACLNAIDQFCQMSHTEIAAIPLFYSSRIIYTAGMLLRLRYLILSLPSHIERDLVPKLAIISIQKLNATVEKVSKKYSSNNFLKKTRLVLTLFIQTYATQVQELLKKNGVTPENLRPILKKEPNNDVAALNDFMHVCNGGTMLNELGRALTPVPLDILSYAASFRGSVTNSPTSPTSADGSIRHSSATGSSTINTAPKKKNATNTADVNGSATANIKNTKNINQNNLPTANGSVNVNGVPLQGPPKNGISQENNNIANRNNNNPNPNHPSNESTTLNNNNDTTNANNANINMNRFGFPLQPHNFPLRTDPNMNMYNNNNSIRSSRTNSQAFENGQAPYAMGQPIINSNITNTFGLANADQLENSYMVLNDEFWADLLRSDQDKINFSNNIKTQSNDELFFM